MEMEHYLEYIDNEVWKVIQNGNSKKRISTGKDGIVRVLSPVTAAEIQAVEKERKAKNILLMAIPKEHMRRFHGMDDAKEIWEAIRLVLVLLSQLEAHGAEVSTEDANHKFLRSLPPACTCTHSTSSTNVPEKEVLAGFADEVIYSLFAKQSEDWDLLHEDLEQIDDVDIEEMDINWQIAKDLLFRRRSSIRKQEGEFAWMEKHLLVLTKRSLNVSIVTTLVTLLGNVQQRGHMMERRKETHFINIKKLGSKRRIRWQLSLNEKLTFQANEIYEKDEKLKRYRRIGMKAVKEKEQLQKIVDSWKDSSKNLWRLIDSGMSSNSKVGLGFEIQSNNEVLSFEEEMNFSVFKCSKEDSIGKPSYSRFTKTNDFKGVPHPLSGDYTPKPQEEIDDSLYVYGKKGPQKPEISVSDDNSSEHSTCQSNDSEGSYGNTSEHSFETESESLSEPNEMSKSRLEVTNEKDVSAPKSKEVKPKKWLGKLRFKRVANTGNRVEKPVWTNATRANINTGRTNINSGRPKVNAVSPKVNTVRSKQPEHPLKNMVDRGIFDSGCSGHMTGNKDQLEDFEEFNGGSVTFGGHFTFSPILKYVIMQHKFFLTDTDIFDMKTPSPAKGFACLIAKATSDESKLWHRRLGHINFKNLNKLVKGNLVRGLPSKVFKNDHTCVACHKGKQHRASCKAKLERLITEPLHTLHMDLFGPTSVKSINHASYCLVITDDCTRFSWVFFLASKDETSGILQTFIRQIENQLSHRVKIIRSDNGTKFKNRDMLEFCGNKGIKQEYSTARTPQQNGVAERMNITLIEAARHLLADYSYHQFLGRSC
ncbi:putative ribonuclease H-like domain-containing protein [Tanacetum coccineum]